MNHIMVLKRSVTIFLFLLLLNSITYSQGKFIGFALNPKAGAYGSFSGGLPGTNFGGEVDLLVSRLIVGVDYYHSIFKFVGDKEEYFNQFDCLIGSYFDISNKITNKNILRFQIQAGIGSFNGLTYNDARQISALGIPVKLGTKHLFSDKLSIGVDLQSNLNAEYPIYMIMVSLEYGKLRKVKTFHNTDKGR